MIKQINRYVVEEVVYRKDMITTSTVCHCKSLKLAEQVTYSLNMSNPFKYDVSDNCLSNDCLFYRFRKMARDFISDIDDCHYNICDRQKKIERAYEFNRYVVEEVYSGVCNSVDTVCACNDIRTAKRVSDLLMKEMEAQGRGCVFDYRFKKIADNYSRVLDEEKIL